MTYFINYDHTDNMIWISCPDINTEEEIRRIPGSFRWQEKFPHQFRCLNDDGEVYFSGRSQEKNFSPLDDYSEGFGVTAIEYRNEFNEWQVL